MFLQAPATRATQTGTAAASSTGATTSADIPAGAVLVVRAVATTEVILTGGDTDHHLAISDGLFNTYVKAGEATHPGAGGAANNSTTVSEWYCFVTTPIPAGTVITLSYDDDYVGRVLDVVAYAGEVDGIQGVELAGAGTNHGTGALTIDCTCTPGTVEDLTWFAAVGHQLNADPALSLDASWQTDRPKVVADGGFFATGTLVGQWRTFTADEDTWNSTISNADARWAAVVMALRVLPPDPGPPVPGTREYQADFETDDHVTEGTSTARRIDALAPDYRTAFTLGPVAIDDASQGIRARRWRARADDARQIWVARSNAANTAWEDEQLIVTAAGAAEISELAIAFTSEGRLVLATERPTGSGGVPQIAVYWYQEGLTAYEWTNIGDGRCPRLIDDEFPSQLASGTAVCPPVVDTHLFYLKSGAGMVRRCWSDLFNADLDTVVTYNSGRRLEAVVKSTDRRITVVGSDRNIVTGRRSLFRADSRIFPDALLHRPSFTAWSSPFNDLYRNDNAWNDPPSALITEDWHLRVVTPDACDAIEVVAFGTPAAPFPTGLEPVWDIQPQENTSGFSPGGFADFDFAITHGHGQMSPCCFRARIRKTVSSVTCYSPWRYMVVPVAYPHEPDDIDVSVNCDHDLMVDLVLRMGWGDHGLIEGIRETIFPGPGPCGDPIQYNIDDTGTGGSFSGYWFVGGILNTGPSFPFPWSFPVYRIRRRPFAVLNFIDEDGLHHSGRVIGAVLDGSSGGTTTKAFDWDPDRFPKQFPDDGGNWPFFAASRDIIASI